jgi:lysophospholipase L1-like esterase
MKAPTHHPLPRTPLRRRLAYLTVPYLVAGLALGGIEAATRLLAAPIDTLDAFVQSPEQQAQFVDKSKTRIFAGDPLLFWRLTPGLVNARWDRNLVTTNAQGLRYPTAVGRKRPGTVRIACFGDSVTFGFGVPLLPDGASPSDLDPSRKPYSALMEEWLRAANPGRSVEVIPYAVPGYSSHQGQAWMAREAAGIDADVVTACFGWNDIGRRNITDADAMPTSPPSVLSRRIVGSSQALLHARRWWLDRKGANAAVPAPGWKVVMRVPREAYVRNLLGLARVAREAGSVPVLVGPTYRDRRSYPPEGDDMAAHRTALREAALHEGVAYMEIAELTEDGWPDNHPLFLEHIHPNFRGHRLMARRILEFLESRGLLYGLALPASWP